MMIFDMEEKQKTNFSLLHAVRFVDKAWINVTQSTIEGPESRTG